MDALSHALIIVILLSAIGTPGFIPFAILGAVILDVDIFFPFISERNPRLYLFTHGGIAHSVAGAVVMSVLAFLAMMLITATGFVPSPVPHQSGIVMFAIILAGAFLHLFIDLVACPGIPILAPFSDKKYTLGILPGPSVLLVGTAIGVLVPVASGLVPLFGAVAVYAAIVVLYLVFRTVMFLYAAVTLRGRRMLTISPFRWLVITENDDAYTVRYYMILRGFSGGETFEKYRNTSLREIELYLDMPDVRRLKFNSHITIAEKSGSALIIRDPLREKGYIYYPSNYKQVTLTLRDAS